MNTSDEMQRIEAEETARAQAELASVSGTAQLPPEPKPEPITAPVSRHDDPWNAKAKPQWVSLKEAAFFTGMIGWLFVLAGAGCFVWTIGRLISEMPAWPTAEASGALILLGCFLHLITQLVYIRSTLERREWMKS